MSYKTLTEEARGELEDRKSRFFAFLVPYGFFAVRLEELRKDHRKANHFVTAHRCLLPDGKIEESGKDDGEPSGTSGMPTLKVLQGSGLINAGVIVVRYFGGIKLGGGGLARAYSGAAANAIVNAHLVPFVQTASRTVTAGFAESSDLERKVLQLGLEVKSRAYTASGVELVVEGPKDSLSHL